MLITAALFLFWLLLSDHYDVFHLSAGAAAAWGIGRACRPLFDLEPDLDAAGLHPSRRWARHLAWLAREIVVSSAQVAAVVLHPRLPIDPRLVRFRRRLPHSIARLTLANSITLTPGTVTVDVEGDEFTVHALTKESAAALTDGADGLPAAVERLFAGDRA